MKVNPNVDKKIIIIDGPSGVGKDSVMNLLIKKYPNRFAHVVSSTTRAMRDYESQGNPYNFIDDKTFDERLKSGDIFEMTERHGTKRGMSKKAFDDILDENKYPLKDCDRFGLFALKKIYGDRVIGIFLTAPKDEVEKRLLNRGGTKNDIEKRLANFDEFIKEAKYYDYVVENIDLEKTVEDVLKIITK